MLFRFLHKDQLDDQPEYLQSLKLPVIVLARDDDYQELVTADEMDALSDLDELIELVNRRLVNSTVQSYLDQSD